MSITIAENNPLERATQVLGTAMMLAWTFIIGIGGFLLLMATAFAFITHNHAMASISIFLLFTPLLMTLGWGILSLVGMVLEKLEGKLSFAEPTWCERRRPHRVIYQAFFL